MINLNRVNDLHLDNQKIKLMCTHFYRYNAHPNLLEEAIAKFGYALDLDATHEDINKMPSEVK